MQCQCDSECEKEKDVSLQRREGNENVSGISTIRASRRENVLESRQEGSVFYIFK